ncbi:MAG: glycyl-radical enzyme activating protein [Syntrophobacter sp.]
MMDGPLIVDIKRHSLEDGPGIRSVVFLKGCPLRCVFCHSPETQSPNREIAIYADKCLECGACVEACPNAAITLDPSIGIDRKQCAGCGNCARACPTGALRHIGTYYPPEELVAILLRDMPYYRHSGGGVTFSGGECTLYPDYLEACLRLLKWHGIHVAIQTSGYFDYHGVKHCVLPYVDIVYFDVKFSDPAPHAKYTGRSNGKILRNLRTLIQEAREHPGISVRPRVPLIPGMTATQDNLSAIARLLFFLGARNIQLLPYNPMGLEMAERLGRPKPPLSLPDRFMLPEEETAINGNFSRTLEGLRAI